MHISVISLLCFGLVLGSCQARDTREFLRDLQRELRDELAKEEFEEFLDELQKPGSCSCDTNSCSCCVNIHLKTDMHVCGVVAFEENIDVNFSLQLNGAVVFTVKIKGVKPPPVCKDIMGFKACVTFENITIDLKAHTFSGCAFLKISKGPVIVAHHELGCFKLPPKLKYRLPDNQTIGL
ncbi:uncharacterized protein LOC110457401 [Mizuhopecten yessoensis]|uniref:DUF4773 domain-containing protein n=1 Tax=Mizuhopecten yessoensis TaxID=6573 RepID=A0A210Q8W1_MIZYE|nr:uncharacterized protein LOC110457401 [Mizuhopecten yessoensis]OWF45161.1 hypothetical protein KP79_PYT24730 [Mizuhopecten yessoensis]